MMRPLSCLFAALALASSVATAQTFPQQTVRLVSPYAPGGTGFVAGQALAERLTQLWGKPVVLDSKPGAGGVIGATFVAKSAADGYTLLLIDNGPIAVAPHTGQVTMTFDPLKDLAPVAEVIQLGPVIAVRNGLGINNVNDLLNAIRTRKPNLSNAVSAVGGYGQVATAALAKTAGGSLLDITYNGAAPALIDFAAERVDVMLVALNVIAPQESTNKFKIIATTTESRIDLRPEIPTVKESLPSFAISAWFGIFAPAGTPDAVLTKISRDINTVINEAGFEEFRKKQLMLKAKTSSRTEFAAKVKSDYETWARLARESNIAAQK